MTCAFVDRQGPKPEHDDTDGLDQLPEGHLIQAARNAKGMNADDAGRAAGFSGRQWRRYEQGSKTTKNDATGETCRVRVRMSTQTLVTMASIVGVEPIELMPSRPEAAQELLRQQLIRQQAAEQLFRDADTPQGMARLLKAIERVWGEDAFAEGYEMMHGIDEPMEPPPTVLRFPGSGRTPRKQAR